jgi:hypothetical protein
MRRRTQSSYVRSRCRALELATPAGQARAGVVGEHARRRVAEQATRSRFRIGSGATLPSSATPRVATGSVESSRSDPGSSTSVTAAPVAASSAAASSASGPAPTTIRASLI